jgi:DNA-directed RNA polymerase beta' subunit
MRKLTEVEIQDILSVVSYDTKFIPVKTKTSMVDNIKKNLYNQLVKVNVVDEIIPALVKEIERQFRTSVCQYGEAVGIIMGQSMGENQTQSTLNSFHAAGITVNLVSTGIPRFNELISATSSQKYNSLKIHVNDPIVKTPKDLRDYIGNELKEIYLNDIIESGPIIVEKTPHWYDGSIEPDTCMFVLKVKKDIIYKYRLNLHRVKNAIESLYEDVTVFYSPIALLELLFVCKISPILTENDVDRYIKGFIIQQIGTILLFGIEGIKDYIFTPHPQSGWLIQTDGTNLKGVMGLSKFDYRNIMTNNMWEVHDIFGIEAVREFLFQELKNTLNDGNYINDRHIDLLVDIMTHRGVITSVSRYGSRGNNLSPLSRVSFEETLDNFLRASYTTEHEDLKSISSCVMTGKIPKIGTGFCDLVQDFNF